MTTANRSDEFMQFSKGIAKQFLHTIVFVDEKAYFNKKEQPEPLTTPGRGVEPVEVTTLSNVNTQQTHDLDAKEVMDTFASQGMICTVLKPDESENTLGKAIEAAKRADALILDWDIYNDNGNKALEIIQGVVKDDQEHCPRLRLILIYSGEPGIITISEKVRKCLDPKYKQADDFTFTRGHLRIAIFSKEHTKVGDTYEHRVIPIKGLPDQLAEEMAHITAGILSNVALKSMSVLRDNTHLLLGNIGKDIDAAYLAHRALLPFPDDAMDHSVEIIASEIYSILDSYHVGDVASFVEIKKYLIENMNEPSFKLKYLNKFTGDDETLNLNEENIDDLLVKGFEIARRKIKYPAIDGKKEKIPSDSYKNLTMTFCLNREDSDIINSKFAILTSQKNHYSRLDHKPALTLGTIVKKDLSPENPDEKYQYWLCIQPRCDCVRITTSRKFLFLPLQKIENGQFNLIIKVDHASFLKLKIINKNYEIKYFEFSPIEGTQNLVLATQDNGAFYFKSSTNERFLWISELKNEHAQRISNNVAANLARVGLNESEWLRRWGSEKENGN